MANLYLPGLHEPDQQAAPLFGDKPGTVVFTEAIGANPNDKSGGDWRWWSERGFRVIVRLNNGYSPDGTIPAPPLYESFAQRCANYVAASQGCNEWIPGNEFNHLQERPHGAEIKAKDGARCFVLCRRAIKAVQPHALVIVPAVAPWNETSGDWLLYWRTMLEEIATNGGADGISIHAYTHGADPSLIDSWHKVKGWFWHFKTFQQQLEAVPASLRHLPVDITETNQGDDAWVDANTGWVQLAVRRVDEWNKLHGTQKVRSLVLYRWPRHDTKYSIADKAGVLDDFRQACKMGLVAPNADFATPTQPQEPSKLFIPKVSTPMDNSEPPMPKRKIDQRLFDMGISITDVLNPDPNADVWRLIEARWFNEQEAGGRHHIYVEAVDEQGNPVVDVPFEVRYSGKVVPRKTNGKAGFDAANFDMYPARNGYNLNVPNGDTVLGVGMGTPTPDGGFNAGAHTAALFRYQRQTAKPQPQPQPTPPANVPILVHPVADPRWRTITQNFGENPANYAKFGMAGHNGIDFGTQVGTPIVAVDAGQAVEILDDLDGYGKYVKLIHSWGESLYAHLDSFANVMASHRVSKGAVIGYSGNTGNSTGPHLHFGMRVNPYQRGWPFDGYSDPASYLINTDTPQPVDAGPFIPTQPTVPPAGKQPPARASYLPWFRQYGEQYAVDWHLLAALAYNENKYRVDVPSEVGALGLMQFMPSTWADMQKQIGVTDILDPEQSIKAAAFYLAQIRRYLIKYRRMEVHWVLAGYNWGMGYAAVEPWEKVPPETQRFVDLVIEMSEAFRRWEDGW